MTLTQAVAHAFLISISNSLIFRGKSASPTLWTTIAAMEAWNLTRRKYGKGIPVGYAFRRIWEGGHAPAASTTRRIL